MFFIKYFTSCLYHKIILMGNNVGIFYFKIIKKNKMNWVIFKHFYEDFLYETGLCKYKKKINP